MIVSMDLNASPEPEEDEVIPFPDPHSEEDIAPEERVEYNEHVEHGESAAQIARRVSLLSYFFSCLVFSKVVCVSLCSGASGFALLLLKSHHCATLPYSVLFMKPIVPGLYAYLGN